MTHRTRFDGDKTVSDLADRYLQGLSSAPSIPGHTGFEPTIVQSEETASAPPLHLAVTNGRSPVGAAFFGMLFPGGGFLFLGRWLAASFQVLILATSLTLLLSPLKVLPFSLALRDFNLQLTDSQQILLSGFLAALAWWAGVVLPVGRAARSVRVRGARSPFAVILSAPFPVLGPYVLRRFFIGHLAMLSLSLTAAGAFLGFTFWKLSAEAEFLFAARIAAVSAGFFLLFYLSGWVAALRDLGIVRSAREGAHSEKKFVFLGLSVILFFLAYTGPRPFLNLAEPPVAKAEAVLKAKGFESSAAELRGAARSAGRFLNRIDERLALLR